MTLLHTFFRRLLTRLYNDCLTGVGQIEGGRGREDDGKHAVEDRRTPSRPRFSAQNPYISITDVELSHRSAGEGAQGGVDEHHVVDHDPVHGIQSPDEGYVS